MSFVDPADPPEASERLKAGDLKNKVCIFRPQVLGMWDDREENGQVKKGGRYIECDVWVLDRAGIVEESTGVRISWWRAVAQLEPHIGEFVLASPREQDDRSVILIKTSSEEWRAAGAAAVDTIKGSSGAASVAADDFTDADTDIF